MKKKKSKKVTILTILALLIVGIGVGARFVYVKTSDKMMNYVLTDLVEAEVAKGLGEEIGDEIIISDPKILENLGISLSSLGQEGEEITDHVVTNNAADNNATAVTEGEAVVTGQKEGTEANASNGEASSTSVQNAQTVTPNSKPIKVNKEQLQQAIEKKVETVTSQVPVSDKTKMTQLVVKYIDKSDINYLTGLMLDGVSGEDLAIAKQIAKKSFPQEAMDEVYNYYKKYSGIVANN